MDRTNDLMNAAARLDLGRVVEPMGRYALDLAIAYPKATPEALADKLLTVWPGSERAVRLLVATAAIEAANAPQPLAA
jgi:hypothetical protein